jgi:hypothetical protein
VERDIGTTDGADIIVIDVIIDVPADAVRGGGCKLSGKAIRTRGSNGGASGDLSSNLRGSITVDTVVAGTVYYGLKLGRIELVSGVQLGAGAMAAAVVAVTVGAGCATGAEVAAFSDGEGVATTAAT